MFSDPVNFIDPSGLISFDFNKFANQIRDNRSNNAANLATLGGALGFGTMSKVGAELRGLGLPKHKMNPYTNQLSRWNGRLNRYTKYSGRYLRDFGRTARGIKYGAFFTGALITDGFYNWWVIIEAGYDATSFEEEEGKTDIDQTPRQLF